MFLAPGRQRPFAAVAALAIVLVLAVVDGQNRLVDGDLAVDASLTHVLATAFSAAPVPLVDGRARAQRALRHGDLAAAAALIPAGDADVDVDLRARVAFARGDVVGATLAFANVGDATRAASAIDSLAARGDLAAATRAQQVLVDHYDRAGVLVPEAAADAWWRLGVLRAAAAWRAGEPERTRQRRAALDAYDRALALAPNEETYLLAVGEAQLELGNAPAARRVYERALEVGPASADAAMGLVNAAAVAGDCTAANAAVGRAARTAAGAGRPWPPALDHATSPWAAAVHRCGI